MSNISEFIGQLKGGLSRPSRYMISFFLPLGIKEAPNPLAFGAFSTAGIITATHMLLNGRGKVNMFCHTCSLPMRSLSTFDHKTHIGPPYKAPYSTAYEPVTFTFYADSSMNTRRYFDIWQQAVSNVYSNTNNFYNEFTSPMLIMNLDQEGKPKYYTLLLDAFPISLSSVDMAYGNNNSVTNVSVTMSYRLWLSNI